MILLLYTALLVICNVMGHKVHQNITEDHGHNPNITTLYPVNNYDLGINKKSDNMTPKGGEGLKTVLNNGSKTHDISYKNESNVLDDTLKNLDDIATKNGNPTEHETYSDDYKNNKTRPKMDMTTWKIDTAYSPPDKDKRKEYRSSNNCSNNYTLQDNKFKPSPQLGHFYDEDSFTIPTQATIGSFLPINGNPSSSVISPPKHFYGLNYKPPTFPNLMDTPYKFESNVFPQAKDWTYKSGIEPKPTMDAPVEVPAGGLYSMPDAFKEKPGSDGGGDNFGLDFKDEEKDTKDNSSMKKRVNPWKSLLNLVTALLPVGIIISALTPSIVTLENADNNPYFPSRFSREFGGFANLPSISENCKRRLLCELRSNSNYEHNRSSPRRHCYKLRCEDPEALSKVLHWLLSYRRSHGYRPSEHGSKAYVP